MSSDQSFLPPLRLAGGRVLQDGVLETGDVSLDRGRIGAVDHPSIDLRGYFVLPGIIDLHGDAFERHIAPRPSAPFPMQAGLASAERDAAAHGVTTAYFAQSWSWEGGMRSPEYTARFLAALAEFRPKMRIDIRAQIRCETHTVGTADQLLALVEKHDVDYVIFNDHLDEALMLAHGNPAAIAAWADKSRRSPEEHMALVHAAKRLAPDVPRHLCKLADGFDRLGVKYGSHDDGDAETRERYAMIGAKISEFPTSAAAAKAAKAYDNPVLMGAPNVVRGGSQSGNIAALDLIRRGQCDALVSDYHYPSLALAAFALVDQGICDMAGAWAMISENPARILGLRDRGRIQSGKRADLVVIHQETRQIEAVISAGRMAHLSGELAARFMGASMGTARLAAE